jgi:hypothetical protein
MIGSHVQGMQLPVPNTTGLSNCPFNRSSRFSVQNKRIAFELLAVVTLPKIVRRQVGIAVPVVKAIDRTALVAV